ncbi:MAG: hypothetical protein A2Z32_03885 [Chloroflexi bacterium RBG_16_69_14]|nr:MAG: hypothetical protein A2Z32_03885 [Chloroflexi bacterium RBG_16_69_14]
MADTLVGFVLSVVGGGGFRRAIDHDTLMAVAEASGGIHYPAESADEFATVFADLPTKHITKHEVMEISLAFVALGALLVALAPRSVGLPADPVTSALVGGPQALGPASGRASCDG